METDLKIRSLTHMKEKHMPRESLSQLAERLKAHFGSDRQIDHETLVDRLETARERPLIDALPALQAAGHLVGRVHAQPDPAQPARLVYSLTQEA